jgi:C-terminal processing protease CtpA/Prc
MLITTVVAGLLAAFGGTTQEDESPAGLKKAIEKLGAENAVLKRELEVLEARLKGLRAEIEKSNSSKGVDPSGALNRQALERLRNNLNSQGQDGEQDKKAILKMVEERLRREEERMKVEHAALLADLSRMLDQRPPKGAPGDSERKSLDEMERRLQDDLSALRKLKERRTEKPKMGLLGITPESAAERGVRVATVLPNGPAEKAGLRKGDVIVSVGGKLVQSMADLIEQMRVLGPGAKAEVEYVREGTPSRATVVLGERQEE